MANKVTLELPGGVKVLNTDPLDPRMRVATLAEIANDATLYKGFGYILNLDDGERYYVSGGDKTAGWEFISIDGLIEDNKDRVDQIQGFIQSLIAVSAQVAHDGLAYYPTSEALWVFSIIADSTNEDVLELDPANQMIIFKVKDLRYIWTTTITVKTHGNPDKVLTHTLKRADDGTVLSVRNINVDGGNNKVNTIVLPAIYIDNSEDNLAIETYYSASDDEVEILSVNVELRCEGVNTTIENTASLNVSSKETESYSGTAEKQNIINKENVKEIRIAQDAVSLNRHTDLFLADAAAVLVESPPILSIPINEITWAFNVEVDSTNEELLVINEANNEVTFKRKGIKYNWDTLLFIENTTETEIKVTIQVKLRSDDSVIESREVTVPGIKEVHKYALQTLTLTADDYNTVVYATIKATVAGLTLKEASSRIYASTPTVHSDVMHWAGIWKQTNPLTVNFRNNVVRDDSCLAIALEETTERPAPTHSNVVDYEMNYDASSWETVTVSEEELRTGNVMTTKAVGWMHGARAWLMKDATIEQTVIMMKSNADGTFSELDRQTVPDEEIPVGGGWLEFRFSSPLIMLPNTVIRCGVIYKSIASQGDRVEGVWKYAGVQEEGTAAWWGSWSASGGDDFVQIHEQQNDSMGIKDLSNIIANDYIKFTADNAEWTYQVTTAKGKNGDVYEFDVNLISKSGTMPANVNIDMHAYYYGTGAEVKYIKVTDGTLPYDHIQGAVDTVMDNDMYATDFFWEDAILSDDWEILAITNTQNIGGGTNPTPTPGGSETEILPSESWDGSNYEIDMSLPIIKQLTVNDTITAIAFSILYAGDSDIKSREVSLFIDNYINAEAIETITFPANAVFAAGGKPTGLAAGATAIMYVYNISDSKVVINWQVNES